MLSAANRAPRSRSTCPRLVWLAPITTCFFTSGSIRPALYASPHGASLTHRAVLVFFDSIQIQEEYYAVYMNSIGTGNRARSLPIEIHHAEGVANIRIDQVGFKKTVMAPLYLQHSQRPLSHPVPVTAPLSQEKSVNRFTFLGSYIFNPKLPNQAKIVITDKGLQPPDSCVAGECVIEKEGPRLCARGSSVCLSGLSGSKSQRVHP